MLERLPDAGPRLNRPPLALAAGLACWLAAGSAAHSQSGPPQSQTPSPAAQPTRDEPVPARIDDPYEAYAAGLFDQALQGFIDRQIERPEDPALALNVGSAHYKMRNFGEADRAFASAALSADPELREQALYNLGNSAYRQGRLEEAVELYKAALEIAPDDQDAKFNLEFVRDEIRRRHEEAQERQEEQQQQPGQDQSEGQQDQGGEQDSQQQQSPREPQQQDAGPDRDQDGLPDATEREGENPTDPDNPDTDGDSLPDGAEDLNRNGRVDPGETDPNRADSDGDGVPDSRETEREEETGEDPMETSEGRLTEEEAERYLQALQEASPERRHPSRQGRRARPAKDW